MVSVIDTSTNTVADTISDGIDSGASGLFTGSSGVLAAQGEATAVAATVPGAPTGATATAADGNATVSFKAPSSDGGSPITSYTVTSNPGNKKATGESSPITVKGLTNGTTYTFTVKATNAIGTGPASRKSNSVTPSATATLPGAPTEVKALAGNAQATVSFKAPESDGGSPITSYTVTSNPGNKKATGESSPITVKGLTNGTAYTFTVTATNALGAGAASSKSNSVKPVGPPGAPTLVTATAGDTQAMVSFKAPASNGGKPITSYTVTSDPGAITAQGTGTSITVTGLTNGIAYTFTVTATNAVGTGPASSPSNSVTPSPSATVPGAPTIGTATAGDAQATVSFTPPASDGGSPITLYTVTSSPGAITAQGTGSSITVTGLTNWTAYAFTVTATNAVGTGPASSPSNSVTPVASTVPGGATLVSPSGSIGTNTPTHTWNAVSNSTWYYLWVDDSTGTRIQKWYTAAQADCPDGTGVCSVTPQTPLAAGSAKWWIQTWNPNGSGPWSSAMAFTLVPPGKATLISPSGAIADTNMPAYTWNADAYATWYYLWVNDSTGTKIQQWYKAADVGCAEGTGVCSKTPQTPLAAGSAKWWIQTWNPNGYGPWSDGVAFSIGQ